jgi:hypothetical protein
MKDPDVVEFRVRCGTAELTENGLDYSKWDDFQYRGASLRLFAWSFPVARWFGGNGEVIRDLLLEHSPTWFEFKDGNVRRIDEAVAQQLLETGDPSEDGQMLIQFHVPLAHTNEVFSLLREEADLGLS